MIEKILKCVTVNTVANKKESPNKFIVIVKLNMLTEIQNLYAIIKITSFQIIIKLRK